MNERHIRGIRNRFILISTLSLFAVMLLMGGIIYFFNQAALHNELHNFMDIIVENDGEIPSRSDEFGQVSGDGVSAYEPALYEPSGADLFPLGDNAPYSAEGVSDLTDEEMEMRAEWSLRRLFGTEDLFDKSPDYIRSTVYFAVLFDGSGNVENVISSNIYDIDEKRAAGYARDAIRKGSDLGHIGRYYYCVSERASGGTIVIYVDRTAQISVNERILTTVLILLGFGTILSYIFTRLMSARIVRSEIENAERQKLFITNASHELKTPLAVIRANTEMQEIMEGETEWTASTTRQVLRMSGLIENLVKIARADEKDSVELARIDAAAIISETIDSFVPVAENDGKHINRDIPQTLEFVTDESMLRQLLTLLLDNAVKYCDSGGVVSCSAHKNGRSFEILVSNDFAEGENVDYSRFFDRFYRADSSHNTDTGGYGIGLSIAESIAGSLGGDIGVSWKDGVISFAITLPVN